MNLYSFYHKESGALHPKLFGTDDVTQVAGNTPADHFAIEGHHDHQSKRVDIKTKQVVEWIPPTPSADHVWNPETKRWQPSAATVDKINRDNAARARISLLEASQHRYVREHCLGIEGTTEKLMAINDEISTLEKGLQT